MDALWLSPIYPSPMADFGYDISDYTGVHPLFGTLQDLDTLLEQTHRWGMKLILDFVPNHTSDEHPWFQESRSGQTSAKRDWYIWRDPAPGGGPPNNWTSLFGGPAWQFDAQSGQYYLHLFDAKQPDLNWRNPLVRRAMYDVLRFWLERGVDGFRVDVLWLLIKDDRFRDNALNPNWVLGNHDNQRIATRVGREQARLAQMLLLTLRGTPTCYYGDELGMQNVHVPQAQLQDSKGKTSPGHSRDFQRTPMQRSAGVNAGFSAPGVQPWLPLAPDYQVRNVESEQRDPRSLPALVHTLLELRRASPALTIGTYHSLDQENASCFVYLRQHDKQRYMVALNMSSQDQLVRLPWLGRGAVALSTSMDREGALDLAEFPLRAGEGCLIAVGPPA